MSSSVLKQTLRHYYISQRKQISVASRDKAAAALVRHFLKAIPLEGVIAGYHPLKQEMDCLPLLTALVSQSLPTALPVVAAAGTLLDFALWKPGDKLQKIPEHAFRQPLPEAERVLPDILIVPLVAFDRQGHRLGFGGGYYDRTLERLKAMKTIVTVGVAYAMQEAQELPHEDTDQSLDWVVTEKDAIKMLL